MEQTGFKKILFIVAWVILGLISCWATSESIYLLQPTMFGSWTKVVWWAIAIIFFAFWSFGTWLIVEGCKDYADHAGRYIIGGVLIMLTWVFLGITTNTHTFFYKVSIKDVLVSDLAETKSFLRDLSNDQTASNIVNADKEAYSARVAACWDKVSQEVMDPKNPGWGEKAVAAMQELNSAIGNNTNVQVPYIKPNSGAREREVFLQELGKRVDAAKELKIKEKYDARLAAISSQKDKKAFMENINAITKIENKIKKNPTATDEPTEATRIVLDNSYKLISMYFDGLSDGLGGDQKNSLRGTKAYSQSQKYKNVTMTRQMLSVVLVWRDFLHGDPKFKGRGLWYWVMLSIFIDLAGFVFFDLAFRKEDY